MTATQAKKLCVILTLHDSPILPQSSLPGLTSFPQHALPSLPVLVLARVCLPPRISLFLTIGLAYPMCLLASFVSSSRKSFGFMANQEPSTYPEQGLYHITLRFSICMAAFPLQHSKLHSNRIGLHSASYLPVLVLGIVLS